eukprot:TRINITY_DN840_c0_g1_i5.p1 TRINITY_DN840_c0_g1~~TRINITY_DN840_c0_g1_i5.p1  ORF type:complete len:249 (+),score=27.84 TRINITY_DN840_c0_g1_i5:173-919(+)
MSTLDLLYRFDPIKSKFSRPNYEERQRNCLYRLSPIFPDQNMSVPHLSSSLEAINCVIDTKLITQPITTPESFHHTGLCRQINLEKAKLVTHSKRENSIFHFWLRLRFLMNKHHPDPSNEDFVNRGGSLVLSVKRGISESTCFICGSVADSANIFTCSNHGDQTALFLFNKILESGNSIFPKEQQVEVEQENIEVDIEVEQEFSSVFGGINNILSTSKFCYFDPKARPSSSLRNGSSVRNHLDEMLTL